MVQRARYTNDKKSGLEVRVNTQECTNAGDQVELINSDVLLPKNLNEKEEEHETKLQ